MSPSETQCFRQGQSVSVGDRVSLSETDCLCRKQNVTIGDRMSPPESQCGIVARNAGIETRNVGTGAKSEMLGRDRSQKCWGGIGGRHARREGAKLTHSRK